MNNLRSVFTKFFVIFFIIFQFGFLVGVTDINATTLWERQTGMGTEDDEVGAAFGETGDPMDIRLVVAKVIKVFLGFLGIIFMVLFLTAGAKWMLSQGKEDVINSAKAQLGAAIIGLIIITLSYSLTSFITNCIYDLGTGNTFWMCTF